MRRLFPLALLLLTLISVRAEVRISIEADRINYLLYAPVTVRVIIQNNTEQDILLEKTDDSGSWLDFVVTRQDGFPVHTDRKLEVPPVAVKAGESKAIPINLTPYYAFREPGNFKVRASVELPGQGALTSGNLMFNVVHGQSIWTRTRPVAGSDRTYTLVRFSPDNSTTELFLRVDDAKENVVYATLLLGPVTAVVTPQVNFDKEGRLHIFHTLGQGNYRYNRVNADGVLENQSNYEGIPERPPHLAQAEDGAVMVIGGQVQSDENQREHLSDAKFGVAATTDNDKIQKKPAAAQ